MQANTVEDDPKVERITEEWSRLADSEREELIPVLLDRMIGWHAWSSTDAARLGWLQRQFDKAGIPFRLNE